MSGLLRASVWLLWASVSVGCSDDGEGGGPGCGDAPCGGDAVGTWQITGACGLEALNDAFELDLMECPSASVEVSELRYSGPVSFDASGNYSVAMTLSGDLRMNIPSSCLTFEGVTLTCDQLSTVIQVQTAGDPNVPFQSVTCTGSSSCACAFQLVPQVVLSESGTYVMSGTTLTTTSTTGERSENSYCVSGSNLTFGAAAVLIDGQIVNPKLLMSRQ